MIKYQLVCEKCGKKYELKLRKQEYLSNRFRKTCSTKCAKFLSRIKDIKQTKIVNCIECGKELQVDKRAPKCKCVECKAKKCKFCGQLKCLKPEICKKYRILKTLIRIGFDENKIGSLKLYEEYERIKNILKEEYWDEGLSLKDIGKKYKINYQTLSGLFNTLKIKKDHLVIR